MTGADHYREAERYLAMAEVGGEPLDKTIRLIALAEAHATLAQAAFTFRPGTRTDPGAPLRPAPRIPRPGEVDHDRNG